VQCTGGLTPCRLLLQDDGHAVVSDFGLACVASLTLTCAATTTCSASQAASSGLSVLYAPPEVLANPCSARTAAGDVYAFGILMLEIATREVAMQVAEYGAVVHFVLGGRRPEVPASTPAAYAALIRSCWAQEPDTRPSFAEISASLLRQRSELEG
jgi:serine/threonine protein kinase